ncbi:MAG: YjjG family noncanonical pyrimidine nucleotidase [Oscillospiraceae bacterium]
MKYHYILLDADNTLFDFDSAEHLALLGTLEALGIGGSPETEALYRACNAPLWEAFHRGEITQDFLTTERFRLLLDKLGVDGDPAAVNEDYLRRLGECSQLLPGALEFVAALAPHATLAVVTNGIASVQKSRFVDCPIAPYLSGIFVSQEIGCGKPDAAFFEPVCRQLGITDRRTAVVIGDSPGSDLQGARNAGMDSIYFAPGGEESPLATYTARSFSEILTYLLGDSTHE